uniref:Endoplasmic reticulum aminopeptidase 1 n=1 Tax=Buteo japonicus TaxID=224669 RepID=A0A8B9YYA6_9AVES
REPKHLHYPIPQLWVKSVNIMPWLVKDHFDTTVKMTTYLVAFIVSDFKSISKNNRSWMPDKTNQADYVLDGAVKLLDFDEDYFSIPYPLPKQGLAAIPDSQSGAMENWGWPTYQESVLLYNPEKSSASSKLWISSMVIAHELVRQRFGNLITMEWWNDLWLNAGFAKFMEFMSEDYFLRRCFHAMAVDTLNSSQHLSTPVEGPAQILEMFDNVSYEKGSCILSMLRDYLTADVFKAGLVQYLQKYKMTKTFFFPFQICPTGVTNKNEPQADGFCRRSQYTGLGETLDERATMGTWTLQKGFPLLTVTVRGKNVHLQQEYYVTGVDSPPPTGYLWHVPLTYITSKSDTVQRFLMTTKADVTNLLEEVEWDHLINLLKENYTVINSKDRASLINNNKKKWSVSKAFDLTLYLKHERQIVPVLQGMNELMAIYRLMERRDMDGTEKQLKCLRRCLGTRSCCCMPAQVPAMCGQSQRVFYRMAEIQWNLEVCSFY